MNKTKQLHIRVICTINELLGLTRIKERVTPQSGLPTLCRLLGFVNCKDTSYLFFDHNMPAPQFQTLRLLLILGLCLARKTGAKRNRSAKEVQELREDYKDFLKHVRRHFPKCLTGSQLLAIAVIEARNTQESNPKTTMQWNN